MNPTQSTPGAARKFNTLAETEEYRSGDQIQCLVCGKWLARIAHKHLEMHNMTADDYRAEFGIPWTYSLTSAKSRAATSVTVTPDRIANLVHHLEPGHRMPCRKPPSAAIRYWQENIRPLGPPRSAQAPVTVPCRDCQDDVSLTALSLAAAKGQVRCLKCRHEYNLQQKRAA